MIPLAVTARAATAAAGVNTQKPSQLSNQHSWANIYPSNLPRICSGVHSYKLPEAEHFNNACVCADTTCIHDVFQVPVNKKWKIDQSFKICLHARGEEMSELIRRDGYYDAKSTKMFSTILQSAEPGSFVDIGASVGIYTLIAASLGRQVFAIEPMKSALQNLKTSVQLNEFSNVTVYGMVIGDHPSHAVMLPYFPSLGGSQVRTWGGQDEWSRNPRHTIPQIPLDMIPLGGPDDAILLMKIDVEGFEGLVVKGALKTLLRVKYLTLEFSPAKFKRHQCSGQELVDVLTLEEAQGGLGFAMITSFDDKSLVDVDNWKRSVAVHRGHRETAEGLERALYFMRSELF